MNYLAHIHLAAHTNTSLLGNFLGDFVKGSDLQAYPSHIQLGVKLHRKLDSFTDKHSVVRDLQRGFPKSVRRMAGVALDIYFDHLLLLAWTEHGVRDVDEVLDDFYLQLAGFETPVSPRFESVRQGLLRDRWLHRYRDESVCFAAFGVMEQRMRRPVPFAEQASAHILATKSQIEQGFRDFYPQLLRFATQITPQLLHQPTNQE